MSSAHRDFGFVFSTNLVNMQILTIFHKIILRKWSKNINFLIKNHLFYDFTLLSSFQVQFSFPELKRNELVQTLVGVPFFFPYSCNYMPSHLTKFQNFLKNNYMPSQVSILLLTEGNDQYLVTILQNRILESCSELSFAYSNHEHRFSTIFVR